MQLSLLLSALAATAAAAATHQHQQQQQQQTTISIAVPASHAVANPGALPPSTHATLSAQHASHRAALSAANAFVFRNVTPGSYLADVHCPTHAFHPLRIDVEADSGGLLLAVRAWETYRGNDWDNRGEALAVAATASGSGAYLSARALGPKAYYTERQGFSLMSILGNPMILMGLVSMGLFVGMPYLMENMDPEMKAEFEQRQKQNPMNSILSGAAGGQQAGAGNPMDSMAAYLAGSSKKEDGNGGGKKAQGVRSSQAPVRGLVFTGLLRLLLPPAGLISKLQWHSTRSSSMLDRSTQFPSFPLLDFFKR
ncbi:uncharacterized protein E0L32_008077 [Thyridium curvatum]|uniref:ER membrane protein complex subunit 7 beta-sandwich domain-containing protein n=1 Tax=Thyridium curvatum TaxID=1093900 RepID=A0A507B377_9PEZI|nr:uncharacterized protein E0L32_008077 [Thyridium curvatum]TPX11040.1 hypothetical protein E0L32_008077 [Thyridium curvatum]